MKATLELADATGYVDATVLASAGPSGASPRWAKRGLRKTSDSDCPAAAGDAPVIAASAEQARKRRAIARLVDVTGRREPEGSPAAHRPESTTSAVRRGGRRPLRGRSGPFPAQPSSPFPSGRRTSHGAGATGKLVSGRTNSTGH